MPCYNEIPLLQRGGGTVERRRIEKEGWKREPDKYRGLPRRTSA